MIFSKGARSEILAFKAAERRVVMKAGIATENGLELREIPQPRPKPQEVLVRVKAAGLNRADLAAARAAAGHGTMGAAIGLEWAGEVVETGIEVQGIRAGDRVMCSGGGGYAEYAVCDLGRVIPIPASLSFEQAATLPIALITMHNALITAGRLEPGESVLIQGATSGMGLMGLKIARLKGARLVIGSATNDMRRGRLKEFGADLAVDARDPTWPDAVQKATDGKGVDLIVDMVSGSTVNASMQAAALLGRIVNVGRLGGAKAEFDFDLHARKRIDYIGVTFRTRTIEEVREIVRAMRADLWDAVTAGKLGLPIDRSFRLDEAAAAQAHMRANAHFGKIVLKV
jgi:NADPH2:quinone reductase